MPFKNPNFYYNNHFVDIPTLFHCSIYDLIHFSNETLPSFLTKLNSIISSNNLDEKVILICKQIFSNSLLRNNYILAYKEELQINDFLNQTGHLINFLNIFHLPIDFTSQQLQLTFEKLKNNIIDIQTNLRTNPKAKKYEKDIELIQNGYNILNNSFRKKGYIDILQKPHLFEELQTFSKSNSDSFENKVSPIKKEILFTPITQFDHFKSKMKCSTLENIKDDVQKLLIEKNYWEENLIPKIYDINKQLKIMERKIQKSKVNDDKTKNLYSKYAILLWLKDLLIEKNSEMLFSNKSYSIILTKLEIAQQELSKKSPKR